MNDLVPLPHGFEEKKFNWKKAAAPAGAALLFVALGWGAGAKIDSLRVPSPDQAAALAAAESVEKLSREEQKRQQEMAELRAHVDGLKSQLDAQAEKARDSEAAVAALQKSLAEEKTQSQALHARLEKLQTQSREAAKEAAKPAKPQPELLARAPDRAPTASVAPQSGAKPGAAAAVKPGAAVKPMAPKRYGAYVLRDINGGVAMVEGEDGVEEVVPGDLLQGGGRVERLERRGGGWVVLTDRGYIGPETY
jgi:hypothetical protein